MRSSTPHPTPALIRILALFLLIAGPHGESVLAQVDEKGVAGLPDFGRVSGAAKFVFVPEEAQFSLPGFGALDCGSNIVGAPGGVPSRSMDIPLY